MKIFVKNLDKEGVAFLHLRDEFKHLSEAEKGILLVPPNEGDFIGPQIKAVFRDKEFDKKKLPNADKAVWLAFSFVGNEKSENHKDLVGGMVKYFRFKI